MVTIKEVYSGEFEVFVHFNYIGDNDPVHFIDRSLSEYITNLSDLRFEYKEFVDANMDNPWERIVLIKFVDKIDTREHKLKSII
jgi:hypothetical protein